MKIIHFLSFAVGDSGLAEMKILYFPGASRYIKISNPGNSPVQLMATRQAMQINYCWFFLSFKGKAARFLSCSLPNVLVN